MLSFFTENGEISFKEPLTHFKQSDTCFSVTLLRKTGSTGRVVVPWKVVDALEGSPYYVSDTEIIDFTYHDFDSSRTYGLQVIYIFSGTTWTRDVQRWRS